jgi:hypothetical protein
MSTSPSPINAWDDADEKIEITSESPKLEESNKEEVQSTQSEPPEEVHHPSRSRLVLRVWQFMAAIGAFGFQVGAGPVKFL